MVLKFLTMFLSMKRKLSDCACRWSIGRSLRVISYDISNQVSISINFSFYTFSCSIPVVPYNRSLPALSSNIRISMHLWNLSLTRNSYQRQFYRIRTASSMQFSRYAVISRSTQREDSRSSWLELPFYDLIYYIMECMNNHSYKYNNYSHDYNICADLCRRSRILFDFYTDR